MRKFFLVLSVFILCVNQFVIGQGQGEYIVVVEGKVYDGIPNHNPSRCTNEVFMWLMGGRQEFFLGNTRIVKSGRDKENFRYQITIPNNVAITGIKSRGVRQWSSWGGCKGNDETRTTNYNFNLANTACVNQSIGGFIPQWNTEGVTIRFYPKEVLIQSNSGNHLGVDRPISLGATRGFANSTYRWQYSLDGFNWISFPFAITNKQQTSFTGLQLLGADIYKNIGKNIFFRIDYQCGNLYSNTITANIIMDAPQVLATTPIAPTCHGGTDGSVKFKFNRDLYPGEIMQIQFFEPGATLPYTTVLNLDRFDTGNSYTPKMGDYGFQGLKAGNYTVKFQGKINGNDVTNPPDPIQVTITDPPPVAFNLSSRDILCYGANDGQLDITATGGTGQYQVSINGAAFIPFNSGSVHRLTGLMPNTYSVRIMDTNGCIPKLPNGNEEIKDVTLKQPATALRFDFDQITHPRAYGYSDGTIEAIVHGGTPLSGGSYTYRWRNAQGQELSTHTAAVINQGNAYRILLQQVPAGTYTLEVWDANTNPTTNQAACYLYKEYILVQPDLLTVSLGSEGTIACHDQKTATLRATAAGGVVVNNNYDYQWQLLQGGQYTTIAQGASNSLFNNGAGTYRVIVRDNNQITATSSEVTITEPAPLRPQFSKVDVSCFQANNGTITIQMTGGVGGYQVLVQAPGMASGSWQPFTDGAAHRLQNLTPGRYSFQFRDANGCSPRDDQGQEIPYEVAISEPAALAVDKSILRNPIEFGATDGSIEVHLTGGTADAQGRYQVEWRNAQQQLLQPSTSQTLDGMHQTIISQLSEGKYYLNVTDVNGCILQQEYELTQPRQLTISIEQQVQILCHGDASGQLVAIGEGGIPIPQRKYDYVWYRIDAGVQTAIGQTDAVARNLPAGTYTVAITDANGIRRVATPFVVSQPTALQSSVLQIDMVNCYGAADGRIRIQASGGTATYQIGVRKEGESLSQWVDFNESNQHLLRDLAPATYHIQVRDAHGCQELDSSAPKTYSITITQPAQPLTIQDVRITEPLGHGRSDGNIRLRIQGGTAKSDGTYSVLWKDESGTVLHTVQGESTAQGYITTLTDIPAGKYTLAVSDAAREACSISATYTVRQPDPLLIFIDEQEDVQCHNGQDGRISVRVTGGVIPTNGYRYQWFRYDSADSVQLTSTRNYADGLRAGGYRLYVTDQNQIVTRTDLISINQPDPLIAVVVPTAVHCYGGLDGTLGITVTGGTAPYQIGIRLPDSSAEQWIPFSDGLKHVEKGLYAGTYTLRIRDGHGCTPVDAQGNEIVFSTTITQPAKALIMVSNELVQPLGHGLSNGAIHVIVDGGTPSSTGTYRYTWLDGQGVQVSTHRAQADAGKYKISLEHIPAGDYTLIVEDTAFDLTTADNQHGCTFSQRFRLPQPDPIRIEITQVAFVSCFEMTDAGLAAHVTGGVLSAAQQDYRYAWFKMEAGTAQPLSSQENTLTSIGAGIYKLRVTDANNIIAEQLFEVKQPDLLQVTATGSIIECGDSQNGTVRSVVTGGTAPYTYAWSNGMQSAHLQGMGIGKYIVIVTDANGCTAEAQAQITTPSGMTVDVDIKHPICYGAANGAIHLQVTGGVAPIRYQWSTGATTSGVTDLRAGTYEVTLTDGNGCVFRQSYQLQEPPQLQVVAGEDVTLCKDQRHTAVAKSTESSVRYSWTGPGNFKSSKAYIEVNQVGTYTVTVTNADGCTASDSFELRYSDVDLQADFVATTQLFEGQTSTLVNISTTEADRVEWIWDQNLPIQEIASSKQHIELRFDKPGNYTITMRTHLGDCSKEFSKSMTVLPAEDMGTWEGEKSAFISGFIAYPNPNSGQFTAKVGLAEVAEIRLRLVNLSTGRTIDDRRFTGQSLYEIPYNLQLSPDIYVLMLEARNEHRTFKIMAQ
ncbi:SprB repeat-containing protein [Sphingobacterium luzhongxinii]|uniref:SprB repeat-containing protein n=1 Tax=Sphingobacterium luzhongxinii TaxID=2654181 RepID=UPI0013DA6613|nr:SprB repeat-containing protein [Sphingobacterium sp. xlx-73]